MHCFMHYFSVGVNNLCLKESIQLSKHFVVKYRLVYYDSMFITFYMYLTLIIIMVLT